MRDKEPEYMTVNGRNYYNDETVIDYKALNHVKNMMEKYKLPRAGPKIKYEYQAIGVEMQEYFNTKLIWTLFHKYPVAKVRDAFIICQKRRNKQYRYLIGVLKKLCPSTKK